MNGIIAWFTRNSVAANLLMVSILFSGFYTMTLSIPTEVFPEFELDMIQVNVQYRGSTPSETEELVVVKIEEAVQDLEGIKELSSVSAEGSGTVTIEVEKGYDPRELLDDVKNRVDAINQFPDETENPRISVAQRRGAVITVVLSGQLPEAELRVLGERVRDDLANLPEVTQVSLQAVRDYEIAIEVSESTLQRYGLTLGDVSRAISASSLDLPAGAIKTSAGEVLLRTKGQAYVGKDFEEIVLRTRGDGTRLTVGDIANVIDGFEETPLITRFNGEPAVMIVVQRVGAQNAIRLADAVKAYMDKEQANLPQGISIDYWNDRSKIVRGRLNTLFSSAKWGAALVIASLALFLRPALAFWVFLGVPIAMMGAIATMPLFGVTFNIFSLFAFILVLGIIVDDAIVTGENVFTHLRKSDDATEAAIKGTQEVAMPVIFGVVTTMIAFVPLLMIEGTRGELFGQIAFIVIPALFFSLVESKLILPAHLKHLSTGDTKKESLGPLMRFQRLFADGLERFVETAYRPTLEIASRNRYLTMAIFVGVAILSFSLVMSSRVMFVFFPRVASEVATATLTMPLGTPAETTARYIEQIEAAARRLQNNPEYIDSETGESAIMNIMAISGSTGVSSGRGEGAGVSSNVGEVAMRIIPPEDRSTDVTSQDLVQVWRQQIGMIPGAEELSFRAEIGRGGDPVDIRLSGTSFEDMGKVSAKIKERLATYQGVFAISDSFEDGKQEIKLSIRPEAEALGLTQFDLANQARQAFFGAEAQRIQRGREEVRVMVRYPEEERRSIANLEAMRVRTADGVEAPFSSVADVEIGRGFSTIRRVDRNRTISVTADVDKESVNMTAIEEDLRPFLTELVGDYPGMNYSFEGESRERSDSFSSLRLGSLGVLFAIYSMLAIPFRSYIQPFIVMSVIPFGIVGAILGHMIMGMSLSLMSIFGMLALSGVVINDSLVMVDYINRRRREGMSILEAVRTAGSARFRPIILTSLTTFLGLMPLMFEKSTQAQFLIPMGVSLGFGILFATFITLLLVPINYLILEDIQRGISRLWHWEVGSKSQSNAEASTV